MAEDGEPHSGIAYCHQHTRTIGEIVHALAFLAEYYAPEEIVGQIEYI